LFGVFSDDLRRLRWIDPFAQNFWFNQKKRRTAADLGVRCFASQQAQEFMQSCASLTMAFNAASGTL
jgi:hypothetical protein